MTIKTSPSGTIAPTVTATIPAGAIAAGDTLEVDVACPGAAPGDVVTASPSVVLGAALSLYAFCDTQDLVTVALANAGAAGADPGALDVVCLVLRP